MKLFISDLHIGSPLFKCDDLVIKLFNNDNVSEIYILGDLFDAWAENIFKSCAKHKDLINTINDLDKPVFIIKGNHDPSIGTLKTLFPKVTVVAKLEIELFGKKTLLIHGDGEDTSLVMGKIFFPLHYIVAKLFKRNLKAFIRVTLHKFLMWKNNKPKDSLLLSMEKDIFNKYSPDYDIIVAGHSHLCKMVRKGNKNYLNCGSVIYKPSYLISDNTTMYLKRLRNV